MFRTIALVAALASLPLLADDDWRYRDDDRRYGRDDRRYDRDNRRYDRDNRGYGNRDRRYGNNNGRYGNNDSWAQRGNNGRYGATPVERTVADLRRAQTRNRYDSEKREHFERAFYHLNRFSSDWNRGTFSKDRLDDAIERIDKLAHSDQIHPQDREMLRRDLSDLRAFRSSRGDAYGYRW
jgi:hypothetical protein